MIKSTLQDHTPIDTLLSCQPHWNVSRRLYSGGTNGAEEVAENKGVVLRS